MDINFGVKSMTPKLHEIEKLRERCLVFDDRFEAGEILGSMLQSGYADIEDGMVLAIPSGGVPVGLKVKERLGLPLDLMIVRKLQIPGNTEAGFGAMTLDGTVFFNETLLSRLRLSAEEVSSIKRRVASELEKRNTLFRGGRPLPDLTGKKVILVDDGLASGYTMLASVEMARKARAREIIVAIPTAPQRSIDLILSKADCVYCANIRTAPFFAVAESYRNWYDLDENEVMDLMNP
jgi:putative phosphoribosyl transferase